MIRDTTLYRRYFGSDEDQIREEEESKRVRVAELSELFMLPAYRVHVKSWLEGTLEALEVEPAAQDAMLLAVGIRKGLKMMHQHLADLEREVAEARRDG